MTARQCPADVSIWSHMDGQTVPSRCFYMESYGRPDSAQPMCRCGVTRTARQCLADVSIWSHMDGQAVPSRCVDMESQGRPDSG